MPCTNTVDVIGFQVYDYTRHFLSTCHRIVGLTASPPDTIAYQQRAIHLTTCPVGIQPSVFEAAIQLPAVASRIDGLRRQFYGKKVILGVDRLDVIKG